jgi:hypothetical protein
MTSKNVSMIRVLSIENSRRELKPLVRDVDGSGCQPLKIIPIVRNRYQATNFEEV